MVHQMLHEHGRVLGCHIRNGRITTRPYTGSLELGQVLGDGIIKLKTPHFVEHHRCDRRYGLGHGVNAHNGLGSEHFALFLVRKTRALLIGDLASSGHQGTRPRQLSFPHLKL